MIITYHEIVPGNCAYVYSTGLDILRSHVQMLADLRNRGACNAGLPEITFDDGHASHYIHALPILETFGFRSTAFVTAGWTGQKAGYMTWTQLRDLAARGHDIQAHGWSHKPLTQCSDAELLAELDLPRKTLSDRLGRNVDAVSIPDGRWDDRVLQAAAACGYRRVYVSDPFMRPVQRKAITVCGRLMVRRRTTADDLRRWVLATERPLSVFRITHELKRGARALIGERLYHRLWCLIGADAARAQINASYDRELL